MEPILVGEGKPLSQVERVVDTYVAPSKTFTDLLRSTSWWLPALLLFLLSAGFAYTVDKKIGYEAVTEQNVQQSQMTQDRMASLSPGDRAKQMKAQTVATKYISYVGGIFFLLFALVFALLNWATINFGFGAKTTFGQNYALQMYASLPLLIKSVLCIILVSAGVGAENFNMRDPIGTNLGYYLTDSSAWVKAAGTFLDVFGIWSIVLGVIGLACISGKTRGQAAIVVVGWWVVTLLVVVGITAATS